MPLSPSKIIAARENLGLTRTEAARKSKRLKRPNWARIEAAGPGSNLLNVKLETAEAMADALDCKVDDLLDK